MFTLAISYLTTPNLPWFMDLTFQVPMQHWSLQHWTLLLSPVPSTTGCCFCFGSILSFFLESFLHWSLVAYWAPTDLGSSSFSVLSFCLFMLFLGFSRQEYWSGLPFPSPVEPRFIRTLHHDPSILAGPTWHGSSVHWVRQGCGPCDWIGSFSVIVVFSLSALWWKRISGLLKLPDGRDWLRGKLGLVLMGRALFSKSLIPFSFEGRGCVPSLLFDLRLNYGRVNEDNGHLLQKVSCTQCYTQCPQPCRRPPPTHAYTGDSWKLMGKSGSVSCGVTAPFSWVLVHTSFCLCPPRVCFPSPV